jgi:hypothetical protein
MKYKVKPFHPIALFGFVAVVALFGAVPASAALVGSIDITLTAPGGIIGDSTPIDAINTVPAADGTLVSPGDGSNIGTWLLPIESIGLSGNSFMLTIASGGLNSASQPVTGYLGLGSAHAQYVFSNLQIPGQAIAGLSFSDYDSFAASGTIGLASPTDLSQVVQLLSPSSFSVNLDNLVFMDRGPGASYDYVDLQVTLNTTAVPLPGAGILLLSGLSLLALCRRKGAHAHLARDSISEI